MGLLGVGTPLSWEETKLYADHVRYHGINQFINLYHQVKGRALLLCMYIPLNIAKCSAGRTGRNHCLQINYLGLLILTSEQC